MTVPEPPVENGPPLGLKPPRSDLLATYSQILPFGQHEASLASNVRERPIGRLRDSSNHRNRFTQAAVTGSVDFAGS